MENSNSSKPNSSLNTNKWEPIHTSNQLVPKYNSNCSCLSIDWTLGYLIYQGINHDQ